jgi:hypothetical protein
MKRAAAVTSWAMGLGLAFLAAFGQGCGSSEDGAVNDPTGGGFNDTDGKGADSESSGVSRPANFCDGTEPLLAATADTAAACSGDLSRHAFRYAVCSCDSMRLIGVLDTDSFRSGEAGTVKGTNAAVGINGNFEAAAGIGIGGSLWVGGDDSDPAFRLLGLGKTAAELHSKPKVTGLALKYEVGGDAFLANGSDLNGSFNVKGKLHTPNGTSNDGLDATGTVNEPVEVAAPCDCKKPIDVGGIVSAFKGKNDNNAAKLTEGKFANRLAAVDHTLPCGKYYLSEISGAGKVTLKVNGRAAIFVGGDVTFAGGFYIDLAEGAELDFFIAGDLNFGGDLDFGDKKAPAKIRLYVGGKNVRVLGKLDLAANLYAPNAHFLGAAGLDVSGSLFAKKLDFVGPLDVHYDEKVTEWSGCQAPGAKCSSNNDCPANTPSCKNGVCSACSTNSDCSAPYVCTAGACKPAKPVLK